MTRPQQSAHSANAQSEFVQGSSGAQPGRAAQTRRYPSDLDDDQWKRIEPLLPKSRQGLPNDVRALVDAIRYMKRTGCQRDKLPEEFPRGGTVAVWKSKWNKVEGLMDQLLDELPARDPSPELAHRGFPSSLDNDQWKHIKENVLPKQQAGGARTNHRAAVDAIRYMVLHRGDVSYRKLHELGFPQPGTLSPLYNKWYEAGIMDQLLVGLDRVRGHGDGPARIVEPAARGGSAHPESRAQSTHPQLSEPDPASSSGRGHKRRLDDHQGERPSPVPNILTQRPHQPGPSQTTLQPTQQHGHIPAGTVVESAAHDASTHPEPAIPPTNPTPSSNQNLSSNNPQQPQHSNPTPLQKQRITFRQWKDGRTTKPTTEQPTHPRPRADLSPQEQHQQILSPSLSRTTALPEQSQSSTKQQSANTQVDNSGLAGTKRVEARRREQQAKRQQTPQQLGQENKGEEWGR